VTAEGPAAAAISGNRASSPVTDGGRGVRRPIEIGETLAGKYLVEEVIGEGGVGVVVAAHHLELDERVAIKFLRSDVMHDSDVVARFAHEAKAAVTIKCEYVARVFDVGMAPSGAPYFVMEYLEGHDLAVELLQRGPLPVKDAVECAIQVCEALAVAHAKGIIHRDIKPENLFLVDRGDAIPIIKVLDFGISKAALGGSIFGSSLPKLDKTRVLGTPFYMSPEQIRSTEDVDARSDIWSLGMVLYELLTGSPGFVGDSISGVCATILNEPLPPISTRRSDLPPGLVMVIERCLEKEARDRFPNVAELALALLPFAPKRARLCAERACNALRAAGVSTRVVSTMPPPSSESARFDQRLVEQLRLAADRRETDVAPESAKPTDVSPIAAAPTASPRSKARTILVGAGIASLVLLAAFFAVRTAMSKPPTKSPAVTSPAAQAPARGEPPVSDPAH
jgi:eukaryotic-like serine/threonine-protein kinase